MISFSRVSLGTAAGRVLDDVSFTIEPGECVCVTGKIGSGKTLLLQMLAGERKPGSGTVTIDGVNLFALPPKLLRHYRREIGVMRSADQLLPDRSIAANIALPLNTRGAPKGEIAKRVSELLERIRLPGRAADFPETLHHGERRRVALAQALACRPNILIADDPLADLDPQSGSIIVTLLRALHDDGGTVIVAARNPEALETLHPRIIPLPYSHPSVHARSETDGAHLQAGRR